MSRFLRPLLFLLVVLGSSISSPASSAEPPISGAASPAPGAASPLAGRWVIDLARSTELSPWKTYDLTVIVDGNRISLQRHLAWGRRSFDDELHLDLSRDINLAPYSWWPDNRHLGAYAGGDRTKRIHATLLDDNRLLRLSTDLVLSTQQGDRAVNILSNYQVSADGTRLTLIELRSTRNSPVIYVFTRAASDTK